MNYNRFLSCHKRPPSIVLPCGSLRELVLVPPHPPPKMLVNLIALLPPNRNDFTLVDPNQPN